MKKIQIAVRLHEDELLELTRIANERYEGNVSLVLRLLLRGALGLPSPTEEDHEGPAHPA